MRLLPLDSGNLTLRQLSAGRGLLGLPQEHLDYAPADCSNPAVLSSKAACSLGACQPATRLRSFCPFGPCRCGDCVCNLSRQCRLDVCRLPADPHEHGLVHHLSPAVRKEVPAIPSVCGLLHLPLLVRKQGARGSKLRSLEITSLGRQETLRLPNLSSEGRPIQRVKFTSSLPVPAAVLETVYL